MARADCVAACGEPMAAFEERATRESCRGVFTRPEGRSAKKLRLKQAEEMDQDRRTNKIPRDRDHALDLAEELRFFQPDLTCLIFRYESYDGLIAH